MIAVHDTLYVTRCCIRMLLSFLTWCIKEFCFSGICCLAPLGGSVLIEKSFSFILSPPFKAFLLLRNVKNAGNSNYLSLLETNFNFGLFFTKFVNSLCLAAKTSCCRHLFTFWRNSSFMFNVLIWKL